MEGDNPSHGEPLPGRLHWRHQSIGAVAGREGPGQGGKNTNSVCVGAQACAGRFNIRAEVPITGVVLHAEYYPGTREGL